MPLAKFLELCVAYGKRSKTDMIEDWLRQNLGCKVWDGAHLLAGRSRFGVVRKAKINEVRNFFWTLFRYANVPAAKVKLKRQKPTYMMLHDGVSCAVSTFWHPKQLSSSINTHYCGFLDAMHGKLAAQ